MSHIKKNIISSTIKIYEVGGSVRDQLLGKTPLDLDYAVEASSYQEMVNFLEKEGFTIYVKKPEFGFVKGRFPLSNAKSYFSKFTGIGDFTLCRKDGFYTDSRRPESIEPASILDDLARRDFTINAMARELGSDIILDPHGGLEDLKKGYIQCVGKAEDRLREDPLRFVRALRQSIKYRFEIDKEIYRVIDKTWYPEILKTLAIERINQEMKKAFHLNTILSLRVFSQLPDKILKILLPPGKHILDPTLRRSKVKF